MQASSDNFCFFVSAGRTCVVAVPAPTVIVPSVCRVCVPSSRVRCAPPPPLLGGGPVAPVNEFPRDLIWPSPGKASRVLSFPQRQQQPPAAANCCQTFPLCSVPHLAVLKAAAPPWPVPVSLFCPSPRGRRRNLFAFLFLFCSVPFCSVLFRSVRVSRDQPYLSCQRFLNLHPASPPPRAPLIAHHLQVLPTPGLQPPAI